MPCFSNRILNSELRLKFHRFSSSGNCTCKNSARRLRTMRTSLTRFSSRNFCLNLWAKVRMAGGQTLWHATGATEAQDQLLTVLSLTWNADYNGWAQKGPGCLTEKGQWQKKGDCNSSSQLQHLWQCTCFWIARAALRACTFKQIWSTQDATAKPWLFFLSFSPSLSGRQVVNHPTFTAWITDVASHDVDGRWAAALNWGWTSLKLYPKL